MEIYDNGIVFYDSIHTIKPNDKINYYQDIGTAEKHSYPQDYFLSHDTIPPVSRFDIYIKNELYDTATFRKFWSFTQEERVGVYSLTITQDLIDEILKPAYNSV